MRPSRPALSHTACHRAPPFTRIDFGSSRFSPFALPLWLENEIDVPMTISVDDGGMKKLGNKMGEVVDPMRPQNINHYCLLAALPPVSVHLLKPLLQSDRACLKSQALIYSCDPAHAPETFQAQLARACRIPIS